MASGRRSRKFSSIEIHGISFMMLSFWLVFSLCNKPYIFVHSLEKNEIILGYSYV